MSAPFWLFGYGSLIWRPNFKFEQRVRGYIEGYSRRFWQASTDHRGVPDSPGRVVTLNPEPGARCWGVAYRISGAEADKVLSQLDHREKGGYERVEMPFVAKDRVVQGTLQVLAYLATPGNPNYVGETELQAIAEIVRTSEGPSGHNAEYVLRLAEALMDMGVDDDHVFELANLISDPEDVSSS